MPKNLAKFIFQIELQCFKFYLEYFLNYFVIISDSKKTGQTAINMRKGNNFKISILKKFLTGLCLVILILAAWQYKLVVYGISQAKGQFSILWNATPVTDILSDPSYPETTKEKIRLVEEIRQFAFDSLGLNRNENYTTFYDQKDKPILWIVTASEPFKLKAREWSFPIIGNFSYKGFFDFQMAEEEESMLAVDGFDTSIDEVEGWSTLGWFKDPILSNMLKRPVGGLSNLIIHELTHGTLYIKNNVQYNENLASFVGDKGALIFLEQKYGKDSEEYYDYQKRKDLWKNYSLLVLKSADRLDSLYAGMDESLSRKEKKIIKEKFLSSIRTELKDYMGYLKDRDPKFYNSIDQINNAYFIDFRRYRQDQNIFEKELNEKFKGDFKAYFKYLKEKYPSL